MPQRLRKLIGAVLLVAFVIVYALTAMTLAAAKLPGAPGWVAFLYYLVAGLIWVVPVLPLVAWMQRPDLPRA
jgi:hypothetical protein